MEKVKNLGNFDYENQFHGNVIYFLLSLNHRGLMFKTHIFFTKLITTIYWKTFHYKRKKCFKNQACVTVTIYFFYTWYTNSYICMHDIKFLSKILQPKQMINRDVKLGCKHSFSSAFILYRHINFTYPKTYRLFINLKIFVYRNSFFMLRKNENYQYNFFCRWWLNSHSENSCHIIFETINFKSRFNYFDKTFTQNWIILLNI